MHLCMYISAARQAIARIDSSNSSGARKVSSLHPMPYALCPLPFALRPTPYAVCPMPHAPCPIPHATLTRHVVMRLGTLPPRESDIASMKLVSSICNVYMYIYIYVYIITSIHIYIYIYIHTTTSQPPQGLWPTRPKPSPARRGSSEDLGGMTHRTDKDTTCLYVYTYVYVYIYIYTYTEREREREV